MQHWRKLSESLVVKYMDGNVKDELGRVTHPGYPEEWYQAVAKADNGILKTLKLKNEATEDKPIKIAGFFHSKDEMGPLGGKSPGRFSCYRKAVTAGRRGKCADPSAA